MIINISLCNLLSNIILSFEKMLKKDNLLVSRLGLVITKPLTSIGDLVKMLF